MIPYRQRNPALLHTKIEVGNMKAGESKATENPQSKGPDRKRGGLLGALLRKHMDCFATHPAPERLQ